MKQYKLMTIVVFIFAVYLFMIGCSTSSAKIRKWEEAGNVTKLAKVAQKKSEPAYIRKISLESLARLNWKPTNFERLQVYGMFASQENYDEAKILMQRVPTVQFYYIDSILVECGKLLKSSGKWENIALGRKLYNYIKDQNEKAVTISLCQQIVARPSMQTSLILLAIKLGINGSQDEIVAVLFEYGNKSMAEDYLNSGSAALESGARKWAISHGYNIRSGIGSNRAGWGRF